MGRIKDTDEYPYDQSVTGNDFLIGSDADTDGKTKNFKMSDLALYFSQVNNSHSDSTYFHEQTTPATVWVVTHNMQKRPTPLIQDETGDILLTNIIYISLDVCHIIHGRPTMGTGTFN